MGKQKHRVKPRCYGVSNIHQADLTQADLLLEDEVRKALIFDITHCNCIVAFPPCSSRKQPQTPDHKTILTQENKSTVHHHRGGGRLGAGSLLVVPVTLPKNKKNTAWYHSVLKTRISN